MAEEIPFSKQMRLATREIHALSDALINAKLAFAMSDNTVWAEGLLMFYEVFRYLEQAMVRLKDTPIAEFQLEGLMRTEAFQKDLAFYLGEDWGKEYSPKESVSKYLLQLMEIERTNPILLMAYIYHLYMGLLSGGQILSKKRAFTKKFLLFGSQVNGGDAVTDFSPHSIASLKRQIREKTDNIALTLDDSIRQQLLEESKRVFILNNAMVRTVQNTNAVILRKAIIVLVAIALLLILLWFFRT
ncbi:heme oxygenase-like [Homalodisca vitripennis]|uniref:heme oxygenase-like n=1 Tax=Homalodisca vitripennis TaxID=197043 RepID=UPI001EEBE541|nr:heme oxygenase-like [Homalodisca vitripennis]XP_046677702.1 heme oxygenase-like [Homalodisca vitripennis]XP_046685242.1 heme oxygenase-like [Homalodisca vitripennis]XP_046685244.1 heme oxygenase-like [Homalodisca vitripennis]